MDEDTKAYKDVIKAQKNKECKLKNTIRLLNKNTLRNGKRYIKNH